MPEPITTTSNCCVMIAPFFTDADHSSARRTALDGGQPPRIGRLPARLTVSRCRAGIGSPALRQRQRADRLSAVLLS
jgi:hypothetical protein